jgi:hypothetical protein
MVFLVEIQISPVNAGVDVIFKREKSQCLSELAQCGMLLIDEHYAQILCRLGAYFSYKSPKKSLARHELSKKDKKTARRNFGLE